jgi:hypothetical protein
MQGLILFFPCPVLLDPIHRQNKEEEKMDGSCGDTPWTQCYAGFGLVNDVLNQPTNPYKPKN